MPEIGKWMSQDPLSVIQEEYSPYAYVFDNPVGFSDPSGMIGERQGRQDITSTFVNLDGIIIDHRDDGDPNIYLVTDPSWKRGDSKKGLPILGFEEPGKEYRIFGKVDLSRPEERRPLATGACDPDFTIESFVIPLVRPIGWGFSWLGNTAVRLVNKGGKWVFELFEVGSGKVIQQVAAKTVTKLSPYELEITHGLTKSKSAFAKLKADIKSNGIQEPIKFVEHDGKRFVVDGHHRLRAAKELGIQNVPVQQVSLPYAGYKSVDDLIYSPH